MRARLSLSLNGFSRRFIVSCVGLCLGLIARKTFGPAIFTFAARERAPMVAPRSADRDAARLLGELTVRLGLPERLHGAWRMSLDAITRP